MKKRLGKKLNLSRETLRNLSPSEMGEAAGGTRITAGPGGCSDTNTLQLSECIQITCNRFCLTELAC